MEGNDREDLPQSCALVALDISAQWEAVCGVVGVVV